MGSLPCHSLLVRSTELNVSFLESRGPNLLKSCDLSLWFGSKWGIWKGGKLWVVTQYDILSDESIQYGSYKSYQYDLLLVCSYQFHAPNWGICCWFISGSVLDHWLWIYRQSFGKLFSLFANYYLILLLVWYIIIFIYWSLCHKVWKFLICTVQWFIRATTEIYRVFRFRVYWKVNFLKLCWGLPLKKVNFVSNE